MGILRDYKCAEHGYFESFNPICPSGCVENVLVVHLKAVGIKSRRTKKSDQTLKNLAADFGMSDIKSTREGDNQAGYYTRNNAGKGEEVRIQSYKEAQSKKESRPGDLAIWGGKGNMNMQSLLAGRAVQSVRGEPIGFNPKDAGNLTGPKAASLMNDHEGLTIKANK